MTFDFPKLTRTVALACALVVATGSPIAFAQSTTSASATTTSHEITAQQKNRILFHVQSILQKYAFVPGVNFENWPDVIKSQQQNIDNSKTEQEFASAVNWALKSYGLSHTNIFTPSFGTERQTGKKAGLGVRLSMTDKGYVISDLIPKGPAEKAGLLTGDLIVSCDGHDVKIISDLAGDDGEKSVLVISRTNAAGVAEQKTFTVTRQVFSTVVPESLKWKGDAAVLTIPSFDTAYDSANVDKLMNEAMKAKSLVIDLRGNGGGKVVNLLHLMSFFFTPGKESIGVWVSKSAVSAYEKENPPTNDVVAISKYSTQKVSALYEKPKFQGKIAVLINGGTGSASEMFAAGLHELRGAPLVGTRSAGAVLASILREIDNGEHFWIQYPMLDYVTQGGVRLEGHGLQPNLVEQYAGYGKPDNALDAAIGLLTNVAATGSGKSGSR